MLHIRKKQVMNDAFIMGQGLGHQLEQALARNDWTSQLVHQATGGVFLGDVKAVLEGRAKIVPTETAPVVEELTTLIPLRSNIPLGAHKARPMSKLFKNGDSVKYYYRDDCFDSWFVANCPESVAGTARLVKTPKVMTFKQMAQSATGLKTESLVNLSRAIVSQGLDITPEQWNDQIVATQRGEDVLLTNGYASFAFARTGKKLKDEKGDEYDEVVMLYADRDGDGRWGADVYRLGSDLEWNAGLRLLLRNQN
ncbi:MAG: hypothetical protein AAB447_03790 [Patescibacteria group bacterium]